MVFVELQISHLRKRLVCLSVLSYNTCISTNADNETFKTGFAFFVHNGKITFQAKANSAGFCIAANGVDNMYGSLRIIKESN